MYRLPRRLALLGVVLAAALATTHCRQSADAPAADASCCELTPNAELPAGKGRIVVSYPGGADSTRLDVYAAADASKSIDSEYGDAALELAPGTYDAVIGGQRVVGVPVQAGHDTRIRTGVLHVHASDATRIDLKHASEKAFASGYGETLYGLPAGPVTVEIAGLQDTALIEDGKVTEF